ncbi:MAG: hypothetical protein H8E36_16575 [Rhodospirillaceae bacterium]|nr:hypothetical protein [Rhodospirillaceae bacterium]
MNEPAVEAPLKALTGLFGLAISTARGGEWRYRNALSTFITTQADFIIVQITGRIFCPWITGDLVGANACIATANIEVTTGGTTPF